jgi:TolA-binding protein
MSAENAVDGATESVVQSTPVAPPNQAGETQGSTPAPEVTSAPDTAKPEGEKPEQSRREARAHATQRREIRDLHRQLGYMQAQMETLRGSNGQQSDDGQPEQRQPQSPAETAAERREAAAIRLVTERLEDAGEDIEGFDEVMKTITGNFPMTTVMRDFLGDCERPAEMAKWLADNKTEAARISLLSDAVALRALERAETKISAKPAPKTTKAPPPVPTVGGRSTPEFDPKTADMDDYAPHWHARRAKRS